jgi:immune inhibitor A
MAQSRLGGEGEAIGTRPGDLSAWDKLQLGWLDYQVVHAGQRGVVALGPHEYNTTKPQALAVVLPKKHVVKEYGAPYAGTRMWWSGSGDDLDSTMTRTVDLTGASTATLTAKVRYSIEEGYDYLYAQISTDGGATWTAVDGTVGGEPFARDASDHPAITGDSGDQWVDLEVPLTSAVGGTPMVRFLYRTDGGVALDGFFADDVTITVDGAPVVTSGAESGDEGWTLDGFRSTTGTEAGDYDNYYLASYRSYVSFDQYLRTGPYNFGFAEPLQNFVEHFSYEPGLLVSYWDTSQLDNNTSEHNGEGLILPIDAHPAPIYRRNLETGEKVPWRSRVQVHDAPFSQWGSRPFVLHTDGVPQTIPASPARPTFDDRAQFWYPEIPETGVKLPQVGVTLTVLGTRGTSMWVEVGGDRRRR